MAYPFGQFAFTVQTFCLTHFISAFFYLIQKIPHLLHTSRRIGSHSITELLQAELHVVEIGNCLAQCIWNVGKHSLEITEGSSRIIGIFGVHRLVSLGTGNKSHDTPVVLTVIPIGFPFGRGDEMKHFTLDIGLSFLFQLLTDMPGHSLDIRL